MTTRLIRSSESPHSVRPRVIARVASGEAGVDEDGVTGLGQDGDSGPDGAKLENAIGNRYWFVEHFWRARMKLIVDCFIGMWRESSPEVMASIG